MNMTSYYRPKAVSAPSAINLSSRSGIETSLLTMTTALVGYGDCCAYDATVGWGCSLTYLNGCALQQHT